MERSRKDSSREETVSQVKQRVSLVSVPSNKECTNVMCGWLFPCESEEVCEGDAVEEEELVAGGNDDTEFDTGRRSAIQCVEQIDLTHNLQPCPNSSSFAPLSPPQSC